MQRPCMARRLLLALALTATAGLVVGDPNDWVNVNYILQQSSSGNTANARQSILNKASGTAKSGPWSVTTKNNVVPPSGDVHDYLSWAPYHWPDCNWCSKGTNHLAGPNSGNDTDTDPGDDGGGDGSFGGDDPYEDGGGDDDDAYELSVLNNLSVLSRRGAAHHGGAAHHRMVRRRRSIPHDIPVRVAPARRQESDAPSATTDLLGGLLPTDGDLPIPTSAPDTGDLPYPGTSSTQSTVKTINGTPAPAQAPAKTKASKCTPSPAKALAPSATWTTCPYVVRDGKVNPDVRTLPDSPAAVDMSQSVLYNAVAYGMGKTKVYSQNVVKFIDAFFLTPATAMNPNMNYGQQVRGPGKDHQIGTFTGILDLRGIVKVVNAIQVLKAAASPDWTAARDKAMTSWMKSYTSWLQNSALGKQTASKANNHLTFYVNQLAAAQMYTGDTQGAQNTLKNYFTNQFLDQIAASGEQPFEAVRTRPYHYRCFNLEAMITNAKLGDQMGLNFWTAKSKYGATIQTALDFVMGLDPKGEDISDIFPHVAAIAAAYGDPKGKYAGFLQQKESDYASQPFWFYDQSAALPNSPAGGHAKHRRDDQGSVLATPANTTGALGAEGVHGAGKMAAQTLDTVSAASVAFECPAIFALSKETELEDGLFVSCDQLRPFYTMLSNVDPGAL
ncbi:chondroitin AC/alginate lyase [Trametes coccinea BRFM310]|uniref:Chondroitin AC/alginate lyase n=1 Tax=Trametes coccinea (strain BRFM310) TaxID=1353009 RepID=A0A1Y2IYA6_TRAC3|nr:chondroitin AC/alginate lyase [Trametes coccinea BRFM310]